MKIIFLGTNGWYSSKTGDTACILIDSKDYYIVLDAGNGIYKLDEYILKDKPIFLFISHFHLDHVSGLHILSKFKFSQGLNLCVPKERVEALNTLFNAPFTVGVKDLKLKVNIKETIEGENDFGFKVTRFEMFHAYRNFGYRFELEGKTISYSGDTGICENSYKLAQNVDLLIHECSFQIGHEKTAWGHVTPIEAANLAKDANVKKLILTHFDPTSYTTLEKRYEAEEAAKEIFENTTAAKDDMIINL
ncbi:MBL fold metallo-hydrolase [Candidatus Daviesbacteria bacterium]|nr:MBL fold metallo-hydrolase [Candidatus Daviesbacteria bacterium]